MKRLAPAIQDEDLSVAVLNHFRTESRNPLIAGDLHRNPLRYWLTLRRADARVVHYHHARWSTLLATALALARNGRPATVVSVHGHALDRFLDSHVRPIAWVTRRALRSFDVVVAVSPEIARALVPSIHGRRVFVIPAYLPEIADGRVAQLSEGVRAFVDAGRPALVAAAYRLTTDASGRMIYGLEFALETFISLAGDYPRMRLVIFLAQGARNRRERAQLKQLHNRAIVAGVDQRVRVCVGEPLTPAFVHDCIFLRPSTTDGDAVAVREALAAGIPVLASDVVERPHGAESLPLQQHLWSEAVARVASEPPKRESQGIASANAEALLGIYRSLISGIKPWNAAPDVLALDGADEPAGTARTP